MRNLIILLLLPFLAGITSAYSSDNTRLELMEMVKKRQELFEIYNQSLEKKSGFFGGQSKGDLRSSQEKLLDVVEADNKIMRALNRTLNFRDFEKQNMTYDVSSYEKRIRSISTLNDTLNKQNIKYKQENRNLRSTVKRNRLWIATLIILLIVSGGAWLKQRLRH